jgi:hypothetical protein
MQLNTNNNTVQRPMQTKTIAKICKGEIEKWAASVEKAGNKEVADIVRTKTMITGGALVSLLSGEEVNDYDIYFRDKASALAVAQYYVELFKTKNQSWVNTKVSRFEAVEEADRIKIIIKSVGVAAAQDDAPSTESPTEYQYFEGTQGDEAETYLQNLVSHAAKKDNNYEPIFISDNAITLSNKIQIVIRFFGEPEDIHKNYDFLHCTNVYCSWDNKVTLTLAAMESIRTKTLVYSGSLYPVCSLLRLRKFIARGWKINAGQVLKIIWQIKALDLNNIQVLSEQLCGVDAAYFTEMLSVLRGDISQGKSIDQTYISNLIDIIFEQ